MKGKVKRACRDHFLFVRAAGTVEVDAAKKHMANYNNTENQLEKFYHPVSFPAAVSSRPTGRGTTPEDTGWGNKTEICAKRKEEKNLTQQNEPAMCQFCAESRDDHLNWRHKTSVPFVACG